MKVSPCKGCERPQRKIGCHSNCELYKKWHSDYMKEKEIIRKNRDEYYNILK